MKILIITSLYPDGLPERTTNAIHDLVRFWVEKHEVVCFKENWWSITLNNKKRKQKIEIKQNIREDFKNLFIPRYSSKEEVKIYRFTQIADPFFQYGIKFFGKILSRIMAFRMNLVLKRIKYNPDIVISHLPVGTVNNYISYLKVSCPKIAVLHSGDYRKLCINSQESKKQIELLNKNFMGVYSRNLKLYEQLAKSKCLYNLKSEIIDSGVPRCKCSKERVWNNWNKRRIKILYVGDLIKRKGVDIIIESIYALYQNFSISLDIVGSGGEEEFLKKLVQDKGLKDNICFVGSVPRDKVYTYMQEADIFVMPSNNETLGLVYLEAMANGCITIGSKNEGIDGIIKNNINGFLVEALNKKSLTSALRTILMLGDDQAKEISAEAIKTANIYNEEDMSNKYLKIIEGYIR